MTLRLHFLFSVLSTAWSSRWSDLLRKELPELTDEDIEWLCGLTETMESHEPAIVHKDSGRITQPLTQTIPSKRRRKSKIDGTASSSQNSREALPLSASANATVTGRKRTAPDPSCPIRRSPRLSSEHLAPGSGSAPNQSSIDSQTRSLDSHHHLRHWLPLSDLTAYSFQEPREIFMVPVPMRLASSLSLLQT